MDFAEALKHLFAGQKLYRQGWNSTNQFIALQQPDENSKMTLPYIYINTVNGQLVPWVASQTDILARDWQFSDGLGREN